MKRILTGITIGIAFGTIISIIFSLLFASGQYNPVNPYSFMGVIYYNNFTNIQIMIFAVSVWSAIGVTFRLSSLIFTNLTFSRLVTTILHFIIMLCIFFPLALLAGWFPLKVSSILIFVIVFIVIYFIIWSILNQKNKREIDEINTSIKKRKEGNYE